MKKFLIKKRIKLTGIKICITALVFASLLLVNAFSSYAPPGFIYILTPVANNGQEFDFLAVSELIDGYEYKIERENATYYFKNDEQTGLNENYRIKFVTLYDGLLLALIDEFDIVFSPPHIYFTDDYNEISILGNRIKICLTDIRSIGAVTSYALAKMPAWFATGLEMQIVQRNGYLHDVKFTEDGFSEFIESVIHDSFDNSFSDFLFIPDFSSVDTIKNAQIAAHKFIQYLDANQMLFYVFDNYLFGSPFPDLQEMWNDFSNDTGVMRDNFYYDFSRTSIRYFDEHIRYNFLSTGSGDKWCFDKLIERTAYLGEYAVYTKNLLNIDFPVNLSVFAYSDERAVQSGGGPLRSGSMSQVGRNMIMHLYGFYDAVYFNGCHEINHSLLFYKHLNNGGRTNDLQLYFSEGLAFLLSFKYASQNRNELYYFFQKHYKESEDEDECQEEILLFNRQKEYYTKRTGLAWDSDNINLFIIHDFWAREQLRGSGDEDIYTYLPHYWIHRRNDTSDISTVIITYEKAISFIHYLYRTYGMEKLLNAYFNYSEIEEIYGKPSSGLLEGWKKSIL